MRLDRLILKAVVPAILLTWVVFTSFDVLLALLNEFDEVGVGDYDLTRILQVTLLTIPRRLYAMFSTAAVVGTMLGLGTLAARSELVALQAAGVTRARIALSGVFAASALLLVALFLGEIVGPRADRMASDLTAQAKTAGVAFAGSGLWLRDGNAVWNAKSIVVGAPGQLELWDVWRYEFDEDARLNEVVRAERASLDGDEFRLNGMTRDALSTEKVASERLEAYSIATKLDPGVVEAHTVRPRQQGTRDLYETMRYARINQLDALVFESAFWYRVFYPLIALSLCFAVAPFAFTQQRGGGAGKRLLIGILFGVTFFFMHRTLINLAETERQGLILVNALPPVLLVVWALWRLRRAS